MLRAAQSTAMPLTDDDVPDRTMRRSSEPFTDNSTRNLPENDSQKQTAQYNGRFRYTDHPQNTEYTQKRTIETKSLTSSSSSFSSASLLRKRHCQRKKQ